MYGRLGSHNGRNSYQAVSFTSQVTEATPHQLVAILFDELLLALEAMPIAYRARMHAQYAAKQSRALTILHGLDSSLDFAAAPELANSLAAIYREARRLIMQASRDSNPELVNDARAMIADIADAWKEIGRPPQSRS